jgi:hypothetical protein
MGVNSEVAFPPPFQINPDLNHKAIDYFLLPQQRKMARTKCPGEKTTWKEGDGWTVGSKARLEGCGQDLGGRRGKHRLGGGLDLRKFRGCSCRFR